MQYVWACRKSCYMRVSPHLNVKARLLWVNCEPCNWPCLPPVIIADTARVLIAVWTNSTETRRSYVSTYSYFQSEVIVTCLEITIIRAESRILLRLLRACKWHFWNSVLNTGTHKVHQGNPGGMKQRWKEKEMRREVKYRRDIIRRQF
jgi:hypothetical protein